MRFFPHSSTTKPLSLWGSTTISLLAWSTCVAAIPLNVDDPATIKQAAATVARGMMKYYTGNETGGTPGNLPDPYFWWECGAMFGSMLDYYYYTGDASYNDAITQALLHQVGPDRNYMPPNQTRTLGNDDQGFWAMSAMSAAEQNYPNPPNDQPQWLALVQAVFNSQATRWDTSTCNGGIRWQIFTFNAGYNYKNAISNGVFFNLASRLAKYTGNQTYADWADKSWNWATAVGLLSAKYEVFDGTGVEKNCTDQNPVQWSYNNGVYLLGAATMYNYTKGDAKWATRVDGLLNRTESFFDNGTDIMFEYACEPGGNCNTDQLSFKAYLSRWMAATTKMAPFTYDRIIKKLRTSAIAAAAQCNGGPDGVTCGTTWTNKGVWDGSAGVGQQMSALEVIQSNLITKAAVPVTNSTGGTSKGDPSAGTGQTTPDGGFLVLSPVTTADKAGAWFLTVLFTILGVGTTTWIVL